MEDKFFQKKLNRLVVKCQFDGDQVCHWTGMLTDYRQHYAEHVGTTKARACRFCSQEFRTKQELMDHLDEEAGSCDEQPVVCPFGGCHLAAQGKLCDALCSPESCKV